MVLAPEQKHSKTRSLHLRHTYTTLSIPTKHPQCSSWIRTFLTLKQVPLWVSKSHPPMNLLLPLLVLTLLLMIQVHQVLRDAHPTTFYSTLIVRHQRLKRNLLLQSFKISSILSCLMHPKSDSSSILPSLQPPLSRLLPLAATSDHVHLCSTLHISGVITFATFMMWPNNAVLNHGHFAIAVLTYLAPPILIDYCTPFKPMSYYHTIICRHVDSKKRATLPLALHP